MTPDIKNLLSGGAAALGLDLSPAQLDRFDIYLDELLLWNRTVNLTAVTEPGRIVTDLFLDSMLLHDLIRPKNRVLDVGSGAGFPGMVLALVRPTAHYTLIEARRRRASFLEHLVRRLGLEHVRVINTRLPDHPPPRGGGFDLVCGRAVAAPDEFCGLAWPWVGPGGRLVLMVSVKQSPPVGFGEAEPPAVQDLRVPGSDRLTRLITYNRR
jgi:16S rRNA (guanine527-N7)-methyltransferase